MKVLHIISKLGSGGAEGVLLRLAANGSRHRHSVVSLGGGGTVGPMMTDAGIEVHALRMDSAAGLVAGLPRLRRLIRATRPDIVQGWLNHGNFMATLACPRAVPLSWNIRQTLVAGHYDKPVARALIRVNALMSSRPQRIIYNSHAGAAAHEAAGYARDRRQIIPNGFNTDVFLPLDRGERERIRTQLGVDENEILVGLIARFDPWKNHSAFFEAATRLLSEGHKLRFLFSGIEMRPENRKLMAMIGDGPLAEASLLLGLRPDIPQLTGSLDIGCNVSLGEGFPNTVGEAMACAVPCVVTPVGDSQAIVSDTGVICHSTRPEAIAHGIREAILLGAEGRHRLGQAARCRIAAHYTLAGMIERYDLMYDELAQGRVA